LDVEDFLADTPTSLHDSRQGEEGLCCRQEEERRVTIRKDGQSIFKSARCGASRGYEPVLREDFTLWRHIVLAVLMQRIRKSYREYVNNCLTPTERLLGVLGLSKIPHHVYRV
jgi:hypothetical protein